MERNIGEIFEYEGEWYQCVKGDCTKCDFFIKRGCVSPLNTVCGKSIRKDKQNVIFKKLEKVGEPFTSVGKLYQHYQVFDIDNVYGDVFWCVHNYNATTLTIEIKETKEDMEEKKLNLKPFDIQKAREGKPVCTRDGRKARIICFDLQSIEKTPIVAAVQVTDKQEVISHYYEDGRQFVDGISELDLMMLPEKKEGWVNVDKRSNGDVIISKPYPTRDEAIHNSTELTIDTVNIEWEE